MKLKKWLTGVLAAAMALSLAACSDGGAESADAGSEDSITLGFAQVGSESEWRTANTDNIKAAAEAAGVTLQFSDAQQKQENQIKAIRSFIASDVDVISFCPIVETGWDTVLQEAKDAGIPVVLVDRGVTADPSLYVTHIFADALKEGANAFNWVDEYMTAEGKTPRAGGDQFQVIAGPCSVEGENLIRIARRVKAAGASMLRGGAYKPRTSPYAYQGMGPAGLDLLCEASAELDMPIVTEIMDPRDVQVFLDKKIDVMQIGARNAQNFPLLKEVGKTQTPILLKRGMSGTIDELLMAAEYIMSEGNDNVILCERGIRTFETRTRNTFDLNAVPVLHHLSHLPVVADPSHATGYTRYVRPAAYAACAAGADGLEIEVHNDPAHALCDGPQSLKPEVFDKLAKKLLKLHDFMKTVEE